MSNDRIEKQIVLKAPQDRVWGAISDAKQFGTWFGVELDGPFVAGAKITGRMVPTQVDPEVAKKQEPYRGLAIEWAIETIEPIRLFTFRWHPYAVEPGTDLSAETPTLVAFALEEVPGGTRLTITESGFDKIPAARRARAFAANDGGWAKQTELIAGFLAR